MKTVVKIWNSLFESTPAVWGWFVWFSFSAPMAIWVWHSSRLMCALYGAVVVMTFDSLMDHYKR